MAKSGLIQTFCFLYLIVSAPIIADCSRINTRNAITALDKDASTSKEKVAHPWCNAWQSMGISTASTRSYHFDVELSDNKCANGDCTAIELVRDAETPLLKLHGSKAWLVKQTKAGEYEWELYSPGEERSDERQIDLLDVEVVRLFDATTSPPAPDKLEIELGDATKRNGSLSSVRQKSVFELEGGLWYNEAIITKGFESLNHEEMDKAASDAAKPGWSATGRSKGKWIGGAGGALAVGGMYTAATVTGVAVQTQALVGAAVVGVIGGTAAGFAVGGFIGAGIALGLVMIGSQTKNGVTIIPASRKIFQKLRCLHEFKTCSKNVLVPKSKDCPRT